MIRVRIPATSANLGAGFDCLGLAVDLYNIIDMEESDHLEISSLDGTRIPTSKSNMIYSSAAYLYKLYNKKMPGLKILQINNIPMTRGLGSSSACIVGGLVGANMLLGNPFSKAELVNIASRLEGHPDNIAPALLGGIVTSVFENDKVYWVKQDVHTSLRLIAIIPDFKVSTVAAREALPQKVSHKDACYNLSRTALFSASLLQGKYENLKIAVQDRLHQPYRMKLIAHADEVFQKIYELNAYAAYVSGAGPTIIAIIDEQNKLFIPKLKEYLYKMSLDRWKIKDLSIDNVGAVAKKK